MTEKNETIKIAIVDDHQMVREGLSYLLKETKNYELLYSESSGEDFLKKLQLTKYYPDIILMDISLKGMDGFETIQKARSLSMNSKFIIFTGHEDLKYRIRAYLMGVAGYIYKGSTYIEITNAIEEIQKGYIYQNSCFNHKLFTNENKETIENINLNEQEREILIHTCMERTDREIADKMCLSEDTISQYKKRLMHKTGTRKNTGLVVYAIKHGIFILSE